MSRITLHVKRLVTIMVAFGRNTPCGEILQKPKGEWEGSIQGRVAATAVSVRT